MPDSSIILSVETATRRGSVCVTRANQILASVVGEDQVSHSNTLLRQVHEVLNSSQTTLADIGLFAAASGPGSFTGLRIGLATVKALAATLNRPCVGIPTLQAVARAGGISPLTVALLPAGRGELFAQMFAVMPDETVVELDQPAHIPLHEVLKRYSNQPTIRWCGEGAQTRHQEIQQWAAELGIHFTELCIDNPQTSPQEGWALSPAGAVLAHHVAALARMRVELGAIGDANSLRAVYVRPSDAELNIDVHNAPGN